LSTFTASGSAESFSINGALGRVACYGDYTFSIIIVGGVDMWGGGEQNQGVFNWKHDVQAEKEMGLKLLST